MKLKVIALLILGIWSGMVLGISFLEAPLKFQAPNITLSLGLGIGQLVFAALNKFECLFVLFLLVWLIFQYKQLDKLTTLVLLIPLVIVTIQSLWLLPLLSTRIDKILAGISIAKSNHHFYYVVLEAIKVVFLITSFIKINSYERDH
ncbi:hypothetical protein [Aureispira anguillae]|uniref:DUF4149 domain-containing protein n=1 Tax=Aureispira anguillae TaxID=2864201 RepID=A0A915YGF3_9BACT|nr:hypothetical protein [Aureispira anguillae]BDS12689.1 hypothetical protein AsAng_0034130 [Aureispira anguillae]